MHFHTLLRGQGHITQDEAACLEEDEALLEETAVTHLGSHQVRLVSVSLADDSVHVGALQHLAKVQRLDALRQPVFEHLKDALAACKCKAQDLPQGAYQQWLTEETPIITHSVSATAANMAATSMAVPTVFVSCGHCLHSMHVTNIRAVRDKAYCGACKI